MRNVTELGELWEKMGIFIREGGRPNKHTWAKKYKLPVRALEKNRSGWNVYIDNDVVERFLRSKEAEKVTKNFHIRSAARKAGYEKARSEEQAPTQNELLFEVAAKEVFNDAVAPVDVSVELNKIGKQIADLSVAVNLLLREWRGEK